MGQQSGSSLTLLPNHGSGLLIWNGVVGAPNAIRWWIFEVLVTHYAESSLLWHRINYDTLFHLAGRSVYRTTDSWSN